jgi:hypothetical protein
MNDVEKPDLKSGVSLASIPDGGKLLGVVNGEEVLLVRRGAQKRDCSIRYERDGRTLAVVTISEILKV